MVTMPGRRELDLFDPSAVADAVRDVDGVLHLATRIRPVEQISEPDAWRENDRLRADASRILVDAAIAAGAAAYVQPTVAFVYPPDGAGVRGHAGPARSCRSCAPRSPPSGRLKRFARAGGRGVVLRFGLLDGPGTGSYPPLSDFGACCTSAMPGAPSSALSLPSGIYNVCRDGERVSSERFTRAAGWHPRA